MTADKCHPIRVSSRYPRDTVLAFRVISCPFVSIRGSTSGFTLVELLVGMSLSLIVMTAVLTTYVSLGRNFTRSLGLSSANQPNLETQARRTLSAFAQDVRMASGIPSTFTPSATSLTITIPTTSGTKTVSYYINATAADVTVTLSGYSTTVPAQTLVRVDGSNGLLLTPHADFLFDRGWITFEDDGALVRSDYLPNDVIERIGLDLKQGRRCGNFLDKQKTYLEFHRSAIFEKSFQKLEDPLLELFATNMP